MSFTTKSSGTTNTMPKYTDPNTLGNSNQTDDGTTFTVGKRFAEKVLTPGSFATQRNDYDVGDASVIRVQTSVDSTPITGIAGGTDGRRLRLTNIDSSTTVLIVNDSSSSSSANRILTGLSVGLTSFIHTQIFPGQSVELYYDGAVSRWRIYQPVVGGGTGSGGKYSVAVWNNTGAGVSSNYLTDSSGALLIDGVSGEVTLADLSVNRISTYNGVATAGKGVVPIHDVVQLTGQTGAVSATPFVNGSTSGLYRASCYAISKRDGTGGSNVDIHITWVDDNGTPGHVFDVQCGASLPLDANGASQGSIFIHRDASASASDIGYYTTYASDGTYDLFLTLEKLSD